MHCRLDDVSCALLGEIINTYSCFLTANRNLPPLSCKRQQLAIHLKTPHVSVLTHSVSYRINISHCKLPSACASEIVMSRPTRAAASLACLTWLRDAESDASGSEISSDEGADPDVNSDIDNRQPNQITDKMKIAVSFLFILILSLFIFHSSKNIDAAEK